MLEIGKLLEKKLARVQQKKSLVQPTRHQQDAIESAEMFNDMKYLGRYLRLFKSYTARREELMHIRQWVRQHGNCGKIFFAVCRKNGMT